MDAKHSSEVLKESATRHRGRRFLVRKSSRRGTFVDLPDVHSTHRLKVFERTRLDRAAAATGFAPNFPSGDEAFDESVLVVTDTDVGDRLVHDAEIRRRFAALLEIGPFKLDHAGLSVRLLPPPKKDTRDVAVRGALERLIDVADSLEAAHFLDGHASVPRWSDIGPSVGLLIAVPTVIGLWLSGASSLTHSGLMHSLGDVMKWGGPPMLLTLALWARSVAGRADAHRSLLQACFFVPMFGFALCWGALLGLDRWVEQSPPRRVDSLVQSVGRVKSGYEATLLRLDDSNASESVKVSDNFAAAAKPGTSHVSIDISTGWLGYDRITGVKLRKN